MYNFFKRLLVSLQLVIFCLLAATCQSQIKTFFDPDGIYSISYPNGWQEKYIANKKAVSLSPPIIDKTGGFYFVIKAEKLQEKLQQATIREVASIESLNNKTEKLAGASYFANTSFKVLNGQEWWQYETVATKPYYIHERTWKTTYNGSTYSIIYNTASDIKDIFQDYLQVADVVFQTFTFLQKDLTVYKILEDKASSNQNTQSIRTLEVGAIDDFQEGFALYRKGERFGIIDKYGNDFIPLGKYNLDLKNGNVKHDAECGFHNGMCLVQDIETNKVGYIDTFGKLIIPCIYTNATAFKEDGYCYTEFIDFNTNRFFYYFLDKQGHKFSVNSNYNREQPLFFLPSRAIDYKTTNFYRKNGTKAFETKLQILGYGDGMYLTNQWIDSRVDKSGFIDTTGKLVIPYKYSGELRNFSEGLALYEPKYKDEYQYAFINKAGEDVIKLKANSTIQRYEDVGNFHNGYATCNIFYRERTRDFALIDKAGNIIPFEPLFKSANPQLIADIYPNTGLSLGPSYFNKTGMIIRCNVRLKDKSITARAFVNSKYRDGSGGIGMADPSWESNGYGMINYSGKIIILPLFADIHEFDEISGLAMASYISRNGEETNGFINQNGKFTIVIKKNP